MPGETQGVAFNKPGDVTINLQLVNSCNFACGHCMYACRPLDKQTEEWVSNDTLAELFSFLKPLIHQGHNIALNLIGGEPTKDLDQFRRILDFIMSQDRSNINVEMTSNGWWLRSWETLCKFASVTAPHIDELNIRLSNSIYHDPFRTPTEKRIFAIQSKKPSWSPYVNPLAQLLTYAFDYYDSEPLCPHCGKGLAPEKCPHCGEEITEDEYYEAQDNSYNITGACQIPQLLKACENDQLYIDRKVTDDTKVSPVGRALKKGIGCQKVKCWDGRMIFTIEPSGKLQGICCVGGHVPLGHIRDGAKTLYNRATKYISAIEELPYNNPCAQCSTFAIKWIKENSENQTNQSQTACRGSQKVVVS